MKFSRYSIVFVIALSVGVVAQSVTASPLDPDVMSILNGSLSANFEDDDFDNSEFAAPNLESSDFDSDIVDERNIIKQPPALVPESTALTQEKIQERYPDGKVHIERWVTLDASGNFVNHGPWKQFGRDGQLLKSGSWKLGQREGEWFQVLSSAQTSRLSTNLKGFQAPFTSTATFKDGQLEGTWVITDQRKNMVVSWEYSQGLRDGVSLWFAPNGSKRLQVSYRNNSPSGSMFVWHRSDKEEPKQYELIRGMELKTETHWHSKTKRQKEEEFTYLIPSTMQIDSQSWEASYLKYNENVDVEPIRHGEYVRWHRNGVMAHKGSFEFGEPSGEAEWWHANGQRQVVGEYTDGKPNGQWVWWHDNGMRKISGEYYAGTQVGLWRSWSEQGQLAAVEQKLEAEQIIASEQPRFEEEFTELEEEYNEREGEYTRFEEVEDRISTLNRPFGR